MMSYQIFVIPELLIPDQVLEVGFELAAAFLEWLAGPGQKGVCGWQDYSQLPISFYTS
jgi:hypothetical protein